MSTLVGVESSASPAEEEAVPDRATVEDGALIRRLVDAAARLALQPGLARGGALCVEQIEDLVEADRARCLLFDAESGTLRSPVEGEERSWAAAGLAGEAALAGDFVVAERAGEDRRHVPAIDDPESTGRERLLAVPVRDTAGRVLAVLVAVRRPSDAPFGRREQGALEMLGRFTASWFAREMLRERLDAAAEEHRRALRAAETSIFRESALQAHSHAGEDEGAPLRMSPRWSGWVYRVLFLATVAAGLGAWFLTVPERATGRAIVQVAGYRQARAPEGGEVAEVVARPGERVSAGDLLLRISTATSGGQASEPAAVRAPFDGLVIAVGAAPGEVVAPGAPLVALQPDDGRPRAVALLPARQRARLEPGLPVDIDLPGFGRLPGRYRLTTVADAAVDRREAARSLGVTGPDVAPGSPVVVVTIDLGAGGFRTAGTEQPFLHGMEGTARVSLGSQRALFLLFPRLRTYLGG